jgi:hypothetical protein
MRASSPSSRTRSPGTRSGREFSRDTARRRTRIRRRAALRAYAPAPGPKAGASRRLYGRPLAWRTSSVWSSASALESHDRLASWPSGGVMREREAFSLRVLAQAVAWARPAVLRYAVIRIPDERWRTIQGTADPPSAARPVPAEVGAADSWCARDHPCQRGRGAKLPSRSRTSVSASCALER